MGDSVSSVSAELVNTAGDILGDMDEETKETLRIIRAQLDLGEEIEEEITWEDVKPFHCPEARPGQTLLSKLLQVWLDHNGQCAEILCSLMTRQSTSTLQLQQAQLASLLKF